MITNTDAKATAGRGCAALQVKAKRKSSGKAAVRTAQVCYCWFQDFEKHFLIYMTFPTRPKKTHRNLIPSDLCLFTGLDQSEKSNFQLMKQINERTKPLAMTKKIDLDNAVKKYFL